MSSHELEYHDDQDDEYSVYHRLRLRPTACLIPIPNAQADFPCRTYSGDSSSVDHDQDADAPMNIILTTHTSSSDSQTNDSLYENAASAMTSYVASLPPVLKQNTSDDIIHIDTEQHAQSEVLRSPNVADGIGVPMCCTSEAVCGMTTTVVVWNDLELPVFIPSVTASACALSALAGGVLCGPMGFVLGASAIGLVAGYGQIPAEYRDQLCSIFGKKQLHHLTHVANQTTKTASDIFSRAWRGTELFSSECSSDTYDEYYNIRRTQTMYGKWNAFKICIGGIFNACDQFDEDDQLVSARLEDLNTIFDALNLFCSKHQLRKDVKVDVIRKEKELRITAPLNKIHSLPLNLHAVAWMGIISSNYRSIEEKHEALQEILLLVKDKNYAKKMLDQGILDSFLSILSDFFNKFSAWVRRHLRQRCSTNIEKTEQDSRCQINNKDLNGKGIAIDSVSILEKTICELYPVALLTTRCCVALGKANCSSIIGTNDTVVKAAHCFPSRVVGISNSRENMEFDSIYDLVSNISIPSWQKLARLLYEYPHHLRIFQEEEKDNTAQPILKHDEPELFVSVKWSVLEAQDIARLINCLATGTLDPRLVSSDPERLIRVLSERLACTC